MVITDYTFWSYSCIYQEFSHHSFEFSLSTFEIITDDKKILLFGKLNHSRDQGVLRRSVNITAPFMQSCHGINCRRRNFEMIFLYGFKDIITSIVNSWSYFTKSFSIGCPENYYFVTIILGFEISDILANLFEVSPF